MPDGFEHPRRPLDALTSRRVVIQGVALSVPAIALSVAVPAFAVSGAALSFSASAFSGVGCGQITDVIVRATDGGAPDAGRTVVLQLAGGYTFDAGAVTATVVTGSDGTVACGTIHVPGSSAGGSISATSIGVTSAVAALTTFDARLLRSPRGLTNASRIPVGAVPVARDLFTLNGTLYRAGVGAVQAGVAAAGALVESPSKNGSFLLPLRLSDGSAAVYDTRTGTVVGVAGTPSGSTPVAGELFLSSTTIYRGGVAVATDVAAYGQLVEYEQGAGGTGQFELPYRTADGTPRLLRVPADQTRPAFEFGSAGGPPSGATPLAGDLFVSGGSIYRVSWDGTAPYGAGVVATGISTWGALTPNPFFAGERLLPVVTTSGAAALFMVSGNTVRPASSVPAGATPIGADLFLVGQNVYQDGVGVVATSATAVGQPAPSAAGSSDVVVPVRSSASTC